MLDFIINIDKEILIFLNNLGNEHWDTFWLAITNQKNWTPLFLFIIYLTIRAFGWKKGSLFILTMIVLVAFSDQFTNFVKNTVMRLRPNNDLSINSLLRTPLSTKGYSFMSGHATTSTAFIVFVYLLLKKKFKNLKLLFLFPIIFAYSRIYLGVHFPIDIITGLLVGTLIGFSFYKLTLFLEKKYS